VSHVDQAQFIESIHYFKYRVRYLYPAYSIVSDAMVWENRPKAIAEATDENNLQSRASEEIRN
jgi:hypothetical protein